MSKKPEEKRGLIGKLYYEVFPEGIFRKIKDKQFSKAGPQPAEYFQEYFLHVVGAHYHWTEMSKYGTFNGHTFYDLERFIKSQKTCEKAIQCELDKMNDYLNIKGDKLDKDKCLNNMVKALESTKTFVPDGKPEQYYDEVAKQRVIDHINYARELFGLPYFIRWYLYFALYNSAPIDFSINRKTIKDLREFSRCCIRQFGTTSKHGIMEIIRLAEREENPNIIAKCEYADILYYGQVDGIKRDINKAYQLYKEAAGVVDIDNCKDSEISSLHTTAYPQALWSVGQIIFNYDNTRVNLPLPEHEPIEEIRDLDQIDRIKLAYTRASQAYGMTPGLPAAANLLGQIAQLTENECPGIEDFKKTKHMEDCSFYFNKAKDGGWVYAYNNLALEELRQLTNNVDNFEERKGHIYNCIKYLHKAAILNEPWAANTLGLYYLEGIKYRNPNTKAVMTIIDSEGVKTFDEDGKKTIHGSIDYFTIIDPDTGLEEIVDSIIDPKRAFFYFKKAYEAYSVFSDRYCGWACANLKCYFSDWLSEEELNDIELIIDEYSFVDEIARTANEKRLLPEIKHNKHSK